MQAIGKVFINLVSREEKELEKKEEKFTLISMLDL